MNARSGWLLAAGLMWWTTGCVSVKAPERIEIGGGSPPPVDSSRLPPTQTHQECRDELVRAYQNIQHLERENAELRQKVEKHKRERDECRQRLKRYEDD